MRRLAAFATAAGVMATVGLAGAASDLGESAWQRLPGHGRLASTTRRSRTTRPRGRPRGSRHGGGGRRRSARGSCGGRRCGSPRAAGRSRASAGRRRSTGRRSSRSSAGATGWLARAPRGAAERAGRVDPGGRRAALQRAVADRRRPQRPAWPCAAPGAGRRALPRRDRRGGVADAGRALRGDRPARDRAAPTRSTGAASSP